MRMRYPLGLGALLFLWIGLTPQLSYAQSQVPTSTQSQTPTSILFENVRIFKTRTSL